jgi:hypothetical protein
MLRNGVEEAGGDLVGVGVEEAEPAEAGEWGECFEQVGEAVFEAEVFAVAGGVLADEGYFADALGDEVLGFGDDGADAAGAELSAELGDDAEGAGMVAAFGDFDVGTGAWGGEDARGFVGVEIFGECGRGSVPCGSGETALLFTKIAFGAGGSGVLDLELSAGFVGVGVLVDRAGGLGDEVAVCVLRKDGEGEVGGGRRLGG